MKGFVMIIGLVLILVGVLALLNATGMVNVGWSQMWPVFVLAPGLIFELSYFSGGKSRQPGLLVPGGLLITYGIFFFFNAFTGFRWMHILWPVFLLGPAAGLFQLYLFDRRDRNLLVPVGVLSTIALIFLLVNLASTGVGGVVFPILLILIGSLILWSYVRTNRRKSARSR